MPQLTIQTFLPQPESAGQLHDWILETVQPYISGRTLETESGTGVFTSKLIAHGFTLELNADSEGNREFLREKFKNAPLVRAIHKINFRTQPRMELKYAHFQNCFPTVLAIGNIPQNGFYEESSCNKAKRFAQEGGNIIIAGRCEVDIYPGAEPDPLEIKKITAPHIMRLLGNCELALARYFHWTGLSFIAVGRKK